MTAFSSQEGVLMNEQPRKTFHNVSKKLSAAKTHLLCFLVKLIYCIKEKLQYLEKIDYHLKLVFREHTWNLVTIVLQNAFINGVCSILYILHSHCGFKYIKAYSFAVMA